MIVPKPVPETADDFYLFYFSKKDKKYDWSSQIVQEDFLHKVKDDLGDRDFTRVRDLFEDYASSVNHIQVNRIESY